MQKGYQTKILMCLVIKSYQSHPFRIVGLISYLPSVCLMVFEANWPSLCFNFLITRYSPLGLGIYYIFVVFKKTLLFLNLILCEILICFDLNWRLRNEFCHALIFACLSKFEKHRARLYLQLNFSFQSFSNFAYF